MLSFFLFVLPLVQSRLYSNYTVFQDCSNSAHSGHIVSMAMTPSAPVSGDWVLIDVDYNLDKSVTNGNAIYTASFNGFPLSPTTDDLCTDLANTTSPCPINTGFVHYEGIAQIGDGSIHGTIVTTTTWNDQDNYQILCFGFTVRI